MLLRHWGCPPEHWPVCGGVSPWGPRGGHPRATAAHDQANPGQTSEGLIGGSGDRQSGSQAGRARCQQLGARQSTFLTVTGAGASARTAAGACCQMCSEGCIIHYWQHSATALPLVAVVARSMKLYVMQPETTLYSCMVGSAPAGLTVKAVHKHTQYTHTGHRASALINTGTARLALSCCWAPPHPPGRMTSMTRGVKLKPSRNLVVVSPAMKRGSVTRRRRNSRLLGTPLSTVPEGHTKQPQAQGRGDKHHSSLASVQSCQRN